MELQFSKECNLDLVISLNQRTNYFPPEQLPCCSELFGAPSSCSKRKTSTQLQQHLTASHPPTLSAPLTGSSFLRPPTSQAQPHPSPRAPRPHHSRFHLGNSEPSRGTPLPCSPPPRLVPPSCILYLEFHGAPYPPPHLLSSPLSNRQNALNTKQMATTMRAVVFKGPKEVVVEQRPVPKVLEPTDAVVKVSLTALCGRYDAGWGGGDEMRC